MWSKRAVAADRLRDPQRQRDREREHQPEADEDQVVGRLVRDQRADALVEAVGVAEVAADEAPEEVEVLDHDRVLQAVGGVEGGDGLRARARSEDRVREAAGREPLEQEHDQRDPEQHDRPPGRGA